MIHFLKNKGKILSYINKLCREHTLLLYLNDVPKEFGGSTTFPKLNITVQPKKNMALYFYNLQKNGEGHSLSLHSGDPIIGNYTKWAINGWLRAPEKFYNRDLY